MKSILVLFLLAGSVAFGQFKDKEGNDVTTCDCKDPIRDLDLVMTLPDNYAAYDYIQFVLYAGGNAISSRTMRAATMESATVKLNVLNSANEGGRGVRGYEYGRFHGDDFTYASYNSLCEWDTDIDVQVISFGISQIGTETIHTIDPAGTKVTSRTYDVYDNGVELVRSASATFKQDPEYSKKINAQDRKNYVVKLLSFGATIGAIAILLVL